MPSIRYRRTIVSLVLALPLMTACGGDEPDDTELAPPAAEGPAASDATTSEPPAEIAAQVEQYGAAWNGEDAAAIATFFTEDATVTAGDSTYTGRDAIHRRWIAPATPVLSDLTATDASFERRGDEILETGRFTYMATPEDGDTQQIAGTYSHTWVQDADGTWRIRAADIQEDA